MSKISLTPNASGTGNFTIASPNSNTDRTLTLPDATGTINTSGAVNEVPAGTASAPSIYPTGDTNTGIFFPAADTIAFAEGGAEAMRLDASGNVQIGRTSSLIGFSKNLTIGNGTNSVEFNPDRTYFDASAYYILNTSAAGVKLTNGATSWTAQSDERLKDIIEPIENASYKISTLRAVIGKYKTDDEGTRRSFLIAQDVDAVLPEAVDKSNPDELGVRYTETIPLLVAAIQEQQTIIETLKADIAELKAKVNV